MPVGNRYDVCGFAANRRTGPPDSLELGLSNLPIDEPLIGIVVLALGLSLALGLFLTPVSMRLARWLGAEDYPRQMQDGAVSVPRMGGLAVFAAALLAVGLCLFIFRDMATEMFAGQVRPFMALCFGGAATLILGAIDDIRGLRARWKLLGQVLIAVSVYYMGLSVSVVTNVFKPGQPLPAWHVQAAHKRPLVCSGHERHEHHRRARRPGRGAFCPGAF